MDLRHKVLDLLNLSKEGGDLNSSVSYSVEEHLGLSVAEIKNLDRDSSFVFQDNADPVSQQQVFDTIEAGFVDENCDGGRYQLNKFPPTIDLNLIRHHRQVLGIQLSGVTNKLFSMIHQKQIHCADELCKVLELQENLDMVICNILSIIKKITEVIFTLQAVGICTHGRLHIKYYICFFFL